MGLWVSGVSLGWFFGLLKMRGMGIGKIKAYKELVV
jgi:hypothetical protein